MTRLLFFLNSELCLKIRIVNSHEQTVDFQSFAALGLHFFLPQFLSIIELPDVNLIKIPSAPLWLFCGFAHLVSNLRQLLTEPASDLAT